MNVTLTVTAGPHAGKEFAFDRHDTFLVGRSKKAHFQLSSDDPYFSREHFLVEVNPPRVRVMDLKSRNGIAVNGAKVTSANLKDGDELKAGHTVFKLRVPDPDTQATLNLPDDRAEPQPLVETAKAVPGLSIPGYSLSVEIGRGAMGVVYRATREADGAAVAVKIITPAAGATDRDVQRFLREARIMNALEHRNIVRCFDSGESGGLLWLAMELVEGTDLRQRVKDRGPLDITAAVRLSMHMLNGLAHAHSKGFVHRDMKPANLMLAGPRTNRMAKVADFGLARAYDACNLSGLTMQGEVGGTPGFMAPEQVTHYRDAKPAADQYAAAATLYYMLCGKYVLDFESNSTAQIVQIITADRVPIRQRRADVPAGLEAAIQKALSREPEDRYPSAIALRDALRPFA